MRLSINLFLYITFIIFLIFSFACKSTQKKTNKNNQENNIEDNTEKVITDTEKGLQKHTEAEAFFSEEKNKNEVFRVFISSDSYLRKQLDSFNTIQMKQDDLGDKGSSADLKKFDKIDYKLKAILKLELYPDTGGISRVRFASPSGLGEIDKIISDDITRWEFKFPKKVVSPRNFTVTYMVLLQKKISREDAIKELKKFTKKKH